MYIRAIVFTGLLVLSLNLFAKGKVCSQSPELLVKNFNIAFEKRDGAAFYDLIFEKSAMIIEKDLKIFLKFSKNDLKRQIRNNPDNKKKLEAFFFLLELLKSSKRDFYINLFRFSVDYEDDKIPSKLGLKLQDQKIKGNRANIVVINNKAKTFNAVLLKENGCWKLSLSKKVLKYLSAE